MIDEIRLEASELWCDTTNALIKKYKQMTEDCPLQAVCELMSLRKILINMEYLKKEDLKEVDYIK